MTGNGHARPPDSKFPSIATVKKATSHFFLANYFSQESGVLKINRRKKKTGCCIAFDLSDVEKGISLAVQHQKSSTNC
jgi:hypothetical protein